MKITEENLRTIVNSQINSGELFISGLVKACDCDASTIYHFLSGGHVSLRHFCRICGLLKLEFGYSL